LAALMLQITDEGLGLIWIM